MDKGYIERLRQRFEAKVDRSPGHGPAGECHLWIGGMTQEGYGMIGVEIDGKLRVRNAQRVAWFLATGEWPAPGQQLRHAPVICHNTLCVNMAHLQTGTAKDNHADRKLDGTRFSGSAQLFTCPAGHDLRGDNLILTFRTSGGVRSPRKLCRACYDAKRALRDQAIARRGLAAVTE